MIEYCRCTFLGAEEQLKQNRTEKNYYIISLSAKDKKKKIYKEIVIRP